MKITLVSMGTTGDVRPMMLLGTELRKRGHQVTVAAFGLFREMIEQAGLSFFPLAGDAQELIDTMMKPSSKGVAFLTNLDRVIKNQAPVLLRDIMNSCDGADAMACSYFGSLYYSVAEKHGIPCAQIQYFPMDPNSAMPISSAPGQHLGKAWNLATYSIGYLCISLLEKKLLSEWRRENDVSQRKIALGPDYRLQGHTIPVVYAVSPLMMPLPENWNEHMYMSGFWRDEEPKPWNPPESLKEFLSRRDKPIVYIGFGSMVSGNMEKLYSQMLQAVHAADIRAVINLGWNSDRFSYNSTSRVYFGDYIPHDWLFPQVDAVVHHGGAGTTASGLWYGKPTLVVPFGGDQPFWGAQIHRLGCGPRPIGREHLTVSRLTQSLRELVDDGTYRENALKIGDGLRQEHGVQTAADILEREFTQWLREDGKHE